jgi:hypothetical protein
MSGKRGKQITIAQFRRLWDDLSLSQGDIGAMLGISEQAVNLRARKRGFPRRGFPLEKICKPVDREVFARMWAGGVRNADIARHFFVSIHSVRHYRDRFGLPSRGRCGKANRTPLTEFLDAEAAAAMNAQAKAERVAADQRARREAAWLRRAA